MAKLALPPYLIPGPAPALFGMPSPPRPLTCIDPAAARFFREQLEDPANDRCCDLGTQQPRWASVSHGIYVSIGASGVHRSLGVQVSYVQSLTMDSWRPEHLRMMELGGNQPFMDFLREQGIPEDMPIREKYSTRAVDWYRRDLRARAEGTERPEPLPPGTGHLPVLGMASKTHLVLDKVFARACCENEVDVAVRSTSKRLGSSCRPSPRAGTRPTPVRRRRSADSPRGVDMANFQKGVLGWLADQLASPSRREPAKSDENPSRWLAGPLSPMSPGHRAAERLRRMSTGRMPGFGPEESVCHAVSVH